MTRGFFSWVSHKCQAECSIQRRKATQQIPTVMFCLQLWRREAGPPIEGCDVAFVLTERLTPAASGELDVKLKALDRYAAAAMSSSVSPYRRGRKDGAAG